MNVTFSVTRFTGNVFIVFRSYKQNTRVKLLTKKKYLMTSVNDLICFAARDNKPDEISKLIKSPGVDLNKPAFRKWMPIHFACLTSKVECAKVLLEAGANPYLENK